MQTKLEHKFSSKHRAKQKAGKKQAEKGQLYSCSCLNVFSHFLTTCELEQKPRLKYYQFDSNFSSF